MCLISVGRPTLVEADTHTRESRRASNMVVPFVWSVATCLLFGGIFCSFGMPDRWLLLETPLVGHESGLNLSIPGHNVMV